MKKVQKFNFGQTTSILDCACGIGTQAIGLALLGYDVTASDISDGEIAEAKARAEELNTALEDAKTAAQDLKSAFHRPRVLQCFYETNPQSRKMKPFQKLLS